MTSSEDVNVTADVTADECADCVRSEDSVGRCFVHSFSHQEPEDVLFADRLFAVNRRYGDAEVLVYRLLNELLGTVPDEAENYSNCSGWSWDAYDRSLEVYGVLPTLRLTDAGVARLWRLGFKRAWLNHSDGSQTSYVEGASAPTRYDPVDHVPYERTPAAAHDEAEVVRLRLAVENLLANLHEERRRLDEERRRLRRLEQRADLLERRDEAYRERDRCVALVVKLAAATGYVVGLGRHEDDPSATTSWDDEWRNVAYVDLPTGQVSWHFHDSELSLFASLPPYAGRWDGHSTEEKYERCAAYRSACRTPLTRRSCEGCGAPADHAEHYYDAVRSWCEAHTPWSGHTGNCGEVCTKLVYVDLSVANKLAHARLNGYGLRLVVSNVFHDRGTSMMVYDRRSLYDLSVVFEWPKSSLSAWPLDVKVKVPHDSDRSEVEHLLLDEVVRQLDLWLARRRETIVPPKEPK